MDCYPYEYSSTRALILIPQWAHNGGPRKLKEVLRSEEGGSVCGRRSVLGAPGHGVTFG